MRQANTEKFKCFTIPLFLDHPIQGSRLGFGENATGVVWTPKMAFLPFAIMAIVNFFQVGTQRISSQPSSSVKLAAFSLTISSLIKEKT